MCINYDRQRNLLEDEKYMGIFNESEKKELEGKSDKEIIDLYTSKLLDLYATSLWPYRGNPRLPPTIK